MVGAARGEFPVRFRVDPQDGKHILGEALVSRTALGVGSAYDASNGKSVEDGIRITIDAKLPAESPATN